MAEVFRSPLADYHASQGAPLGTYHGAIVPARFSDWYAGRDPAFDGAVALANNTETYRSQPPA